MGALDATDSHLARLVDEAHAGDTKFAFNSGASTSVHVFGPGQFTLEEPRLWAWWADDRLCTGRWSTTRFRLCMAKGAGYVDECRGPGSGGAECAEVVGTDG